MLRYYKYIYYYEEEKNEEDFVIGACVADGT